MEDFYYLEKALNSLSNYEQKRFKIFLQSPYFNKRHRRTSGVRKLYNEILCNNAVTIDSKYFRWNRYIRKMYPQIKDDSSFCNKLICELKSDLLSCFYDFIAFENFNNDRFLYHLRILKELDKRNLIDIFMHWGKAERFNKIEEFYDNSEYSYYMWKLFQTMNKHRERRDFSRDYIDYDLEKMLLKQYFKAELIRFQDRKSN